MVEMLPVRREHDQILDPVVIRVRISMMDDFLRVEMPAEMKFHHEPVLSHVPPLRRVRVVWMEDVPVAT